MQRNIHIKNFKGLENLDVQGLGNFTLLGGRNDVGKSSFLEAFFMFYDRANGASLVSHFGWRGVPGADGSPEALWGALFYKLDMTREISITVSDAAGHKTSVTYRLKRNDVPVSAYAPFQAGNALILQSQQGGQGSMHVSARVGTKPAQSTDVVIGPGGITTTGSVMIPETRVAIYLTLSGRINDPGAPQRLTQLDVKGIKQKAVEVARLIDDRVIDLSIGVLGQNQPYVLAQTSDLSKKIPLNLLGGGVAVAVNVVLAILAAPNGIVFIDEIETGIHHAALRDFIKTISDVAASNNTQIIATTHSYECIKTAFEVFGENSPQRFSYIRLDRDRSGAVLAKRYPSEQLAYAIESQWEIR